MSTIVREKVNQAVGILDDLDIDVWLTFVRETEETGDPVLPLILGVPMTWQSAFIIGRNGKRVAIVGRYEEEAVQSTGAWPRVINYVQSVREPIVEQLEALEPERIAINYSSDDVKADGLSHGMYELLQDYLGPSGLADRLVSAEQIIRRLRGVKTPSELDRIRTAIATTNQIFDAVRSFARPGRHELEIASFMHERIHEHGLEPAWEMAQCPIVTTGPDSMVGHGLPSQSLVVEPGWIFHLDFGIRQDEYCTDMQRAWYVPEPGETCPPSEVQRGFETIVRALDAAAAQLRPGVQGWQVDAAARKVIVDAGYPEYQHATGHHVGRAAHDGGAVLGPQWERYGRTPCYPVEPGNVFTLELGIENLDGRGYLGLEEMVLVTDDGCEWLTPRQTELYLL